jgi:hypothetical protein
MIGNFNLPLAKGNAKTYVFDVLGGTLDPASGTSRGISHTTWEKPKGINFIYGLFINPGTGGGGGFSFGAGGTQGGGGGGGTPGSIAQFLQPAYLFPDSVLITVGRGGAGGAAGTAGTLPNNQQTSIYYPQQVQGATNFGASLLGSYIYSTGYYGYAGSTAASGRGGAAGSGGNGGTAVTAATAASIPGVAGFGNFVLYSSLAGFNGTLVAGTDATYAGRVGGGAGGGGVTAGVAYPGGNVIAPSTSANSIWNRNLSGGANTGSAGENGIELFSPTLFSLPGAGGGANLTGTGGAGGKGGIGCGGGGGGAGVTGGRGGDGGDGLAILVCW